MMNFKRGFSLAEILAAVAVISVISAIVIGSINEGRAKARDAVRVESLNTLKEALRAYHVQFGAYPVGSDTTTGTFCDNDSGTDDCSGETSQEADFLQELVNEGFLSEVIRDPLNKTDGSVNYYIGYAYNANTQSFVLGVPLEKNSPLMHEGSDGGPCNDIYEVYVLTELENITDLQVDESKVGDSSVPCEVQFGTGAGNSSGRGGK